MKNLLLAGALLLASLSAATAQATAASVTVPWGDWAAALLMTVASVVMPIITWALRFMPAQIQSVIRTAQIEQLLSKAINYGLNTTAGAVKGKALDVKVGNEVVAEAVNYALKHGPAWVEQWLGGEMGIRDRIIARLDAAQDAALK